MNKKETDKSKNRNIVNERQKDKFRDIEASNFMEDKIVGEKPRMKNVLRDMEDEFLIGKQEDER